jgi:hypothetical protein
VAGVPTTRELAIDVVTSEDFQSGTYTTAFLHEAVGRLATLASP